MNPNIKSVTSMILVMVMVGLSFRFFGSIIPRPETPADEISYGAFMSEVSKGNIKKVVLNNDGNIEGEFKNPVNGLSAFKSKILPFTMDFAEPQRQRIQASNPEAEIAINEVRPSIWPVVISWVIPLLLLVFLWSFFQKQMSGRGGGAFSFSKSNAKRMSADAMKINFRDVEGQDEAKQELDEIVQFLKEPQKFQCLGGRIPKGVLLMGPPGTGKTLLARAVAGEANVPFFSISGSNFVEMFVGVGASRVRDLFEQGKKNAPCIIFIDEIDAVGRHRGAGLGGGHDEREQTLNQLLVEMDGFESNAGVILMAATNRPDVLDPALLRPGRFDRRIIVSNPDIRGREGILTVHTRKIPLDKDVNLPVIARGTAGFSGADLANVANEAALNAARYGRKAVAMEDFEFAKDKVLMGAERKSLVISEKERETTAVHEAGHALLAVIFPNADPLHKVTIIPRGMAMGLTQQLPLEERHNYSEEYLHDHLIILMAGRCAEEVLLGGQKTTGASNDFQRANELAHRMVCEWGMSDLGPLSFQNEKADPFLGKSLAEKPYEHSEMTKQKIDEEKNKIVMNAYTKAKRNIESRKDKVQKITDELLAKEVLDGERVKQIVLNS